MVPRMFTALNRVRFLQVLDGSMSHDSSCLGISVARTVAHIILANIVLVPIGKVALIFPDDGNDCVLFSELGHLIMCRQSFQTCLQQQGSHHLARVWRLVATS